MWCQSLMDRRSADGHRKKKVPKHFAEGEGLTMDEVQIIKGALDMRMKIAEDVMTPWSKVVMVR